MKNNIYCRILITVVAALLFVALQPSILNAAEKCAEPAKVGINKGMKVLAALAGPNWQVAKVSSVVDGKITVTYPDGGKGSLSAREVAPMPSGIPPCFKKGDKVLAHAESDIWREAKIVDVTENGATVQFLDKKKQARPFSEIARFPK